MSKGYLESNNQIYLVDLITLPNKFGSYKNFGYVQHHQTPF